MEALDEKCFSCFLKGPSCRGAAPDGAELRQEDIAAHRGISRLPVREAMQQLQNEGLLERLPNRHVRVVGVTAARLRQSFAVLAAMECELFALADTALREKGLPDPACDAEFHLAAAEVLDNPTLYQRFFTQRQGLLDAAQALGAAEPAALIERNRAIAEAFTVGKDTAPHIRRYYDDLTEQTAKELVV